VVFVVAGNIVAIVVDDEEIVKIKILIELKFDLGIEIGG
jgi:hypothetical protein